MTPSLGDFFPSQQKEDFAKNNIKRGTVIFNIYPGRKEKKGKRFVVIGISIPDDQVAVLVFNTEKPFVGNPKLEPLQILFNEAGRDYLDHECYLNCAHLDLISYKGLFNDIKENPSHILGSMSGTDLNNACTTASTSVVISSKHKVKFGLPSHKKP